MYTWHASECAGERCQCMECVSGKNHRYHRYHSPQLATVTSNTATYHTTECNIPFWCIVALFHHEQVGISCTYLLQQQWKSGTPL
eukprot:m.81996 g.81996  ORF g.81996 m.81996 type:complete len:85 (+) comp12664_c0_seq3:2291-2545(+)